MTQKSVTKEREESPESVWKLARVNGPVREGEKTRKTSQGCGRDCGWFLSRKESIATAGHQDSGANESDLHGYIFTTSFFVLGHSSAHHFFFLSNVQVNALKL